MALKTPRQIVTKIKSLKKEITLLERARKAELKANSAVKAASKSRGRSRSRKKSAQKKRR